MNIVKVQFISVLHLRIYYTYEIIEIIYETLFMDVNAWGRGDGREDDGEQKMTMCNKMGPR